MYLLGYDIGSSSVKGSLVDAQSGKTVAFASFPSHEAIIISKKAGWAEQEPAMWWGNLKNVTAKLLSQMGSSFSPKDIGAIGISYQMHGLVCVDKDRHVLRPSIIWCDSRAVPYGNAAADALGKEWCLQHLLNSPGNFTAAKLAWVKKNEPALYDRIWKIMLPGDYIAMRLTGTVCTTVSGLSEGIFWDFQRNAPCTELLDYFGFDETVLPQIKPTFGAQGVLSKEAAQELGLAEGTPVTYRAGDQPNNALSLNVFEPGEIAPRPVHGALRFCELPGKSERRFIHRRAAGEGEPHLHAHPVDRLTRVDVPRPADAGDSENFVVVRLDQEDVGRPAGDVEGEEGIF